MQKYEENKFEIGELIGISTKTTEEHLKLYSGYVKNTNSILEKIQEYKKYANEDSFSPYIINELHRRFSFEYNGMRNHEVYFKSLEKGACEPEIKSALFQAIEKTWGEFDTWLLEFKALALTRGIGWAMLYYDTKDDQLLNSWVDEQHLGQLQDCKVVLALDMWEHSYVADYQPSGKKQYAEDFFKNLNWSVIENNFINTN